MAIDFREIVEAQKKALTLVDDPERRRALEQFIDGTGPLVEAAMRQSLQSLVDEINEQLAPHSRLRLIQEGTRLIPEVVQLGQERGKGWTLKVDSADVSKVLVRMPSVVKDLASESAQKAGMSLNSWTVNILERALDNLRHEQPKSSGTQSRSTERVDGPKDSSQDTPKDTSIEKPENSKPEVDPRIADTNQNEHD